MKIQTDGPFTTCIFDKKEQQDALHYWTPERMAQAKPIFSAEESSLPDADTQPSTEADVSVSPYWCGGKWFYSYNGEPWVGSGSFVGDKQIILTAAHCIRDGATGEWKTNLIFRRAYKNGSCAETFAINAVTLYTAFGPPENFTYDFGFASTSKSKFCSVTPLAYSLTVPDKATLFGYPANIQEGKIMQKVTSPIDKTAVPGMIQATDDPFQGGSSGGPWVDATNQVIGVIATRRVTGRQDSPVFAGKFEALYQYALAHK